MIKAGRNDPLHDSSPPLVFGYSNLMIDRPICDLSSSENIIDIAGLVDEDGGTVFFILHVFRGVRLRGSKS